MTLVSGLFKIVCATCPAHVRVHESVRYQDGLLIHYECHGKHHLAAMHPFFSRVISHRNGERYEYAFNTVKPDVSCLREPVGCIYVLDTELASLSPEEIADMHKHLADRFQSAEQPSFINDDEWAQLIADGRKTLDLLGRFTKTEE